MKFQALADILAARNHFERLLALEAKIKACQQPETAAPWRTEADEAASRVRQTYVRLAALQNRPVPQTFTEQDRQTLENLEQACVQAVIPLWLHLQFHPVWKTFDKVLGPVPKLIGPVLAAQQRMAILFKASETTGTTWQAYRGVVEQKQWQDLEKELEETFAFLARPAAMAEKGNMADLASDHDHPAFKSNPSWSAQVPESPNLQNQTHSLDNPSAPAYLQYQNRKQISGALFRPGKPPAMQKAGHPEDFPLECKNGGDAAGFAVPGLAPSEGVQVQDSRQDSDRRPMPEVQAGSLLPKPPAAKPAPGTSQCGPENRQLPESPSDDLRLESPNSEPDPESRGAFPRRESQAGEQSATTTILPKWGAVQQLGVEKPAFSILPIPGTRRGALVDWTGTLFEYLRPPQSGPSQQPDPSAEATPQHLAELQNFMQVKNVSQIHWVITPRTPGQTTNGRQTFSDPVLKHLIHPQAQFVPWQDFTNWVRRKSRRIPVFNEIEGRPRFNRPAGSARALPGKPYSGASSPPEGYMPGLPAKPMPAACTDTAYVPAFPHSHLWSQKNISGPGCDTTSQPGPQLILAQPPKAGEEWFPLPEPAANQSCVSLPLLVQNSLFPFYQTADIPAPKFAVRFKALPDKSGQPQAADIPKSNSFSVQTESSPRTGAWPAFYQHVEKSLWPQENIREAAAGDKSGILPQVFYRPGRPAQPLIDGQGPQIPSGKQSAPPPAEAFRPPGINSRPKPGVHLAEKNREAPEFPASSPIPGKKRTVVHLAGEFYSWFMRRLRFDQEQQFAGENHYGARN